MSVSINFGKVYGLDVKMRRFPSIWSRKEREIQAKGADLMLAEIRVGASGPPGPNIQTGAYRDSWYKVDRGVFLGWLLTTDAPQAARLEYGFFGTDSHGRNYNQSARPHVRPAIERMRPVFTKMYAAGAKEAWGEAR